MYTHKHPLTKKILLITEPLYEWLVKLWVFQSCFKTNVKQPDRRGGGGEKKCVKGEKDGQRRCHMLPIHRLKQSILLNIRFTLWLATPRCPLAVSGPNLLNQLAHHRAAASEIKPTCTTQNNIHGLFVEVWFNPGDDRGLQNDQLHVGK